MTQQQHLEHIQSSRTNRDTAIARVLHAYYAGTLHPSINPEAARNVAINCAVAAIDDDIANNRPTGQPAQ